MVHTNDGTLVETEYIVMFVAQLWVVRSVGRGHRTRRNNLGRMLVHTACFNGQRLYTSVAPNVIRRRYHLVLLGVSWG